MRSVTGNLVTVVTMLHSAAASPTGNRKRDESEGGFGLISSFLPKEAISQSELRKVFLMSLARYCGGQTQSHALDESCS